MPGLALESIALEAEPTLATLHLPLNLWVIESSPHAYPVESAPAVADGMVYITSTDGNLYALNANTGEKLWSFAAESSPYT
jgi:outer membrane protein assembly factor BamB